MEYLKEIINPTFFIDDQMSKEKKVQVETFRKLLIVLATIKPAKFNVILFQNCYVLIHFYDCIQLFYFLSLLVSLYNK